MASNTYTLLLYTLGPGGCQPAEITAMRRGIRGREMGKGRGMGEGRRGEKVQGTREGERNKGRQMWGTLANRKWRVHRATREGRGNMFKVLSKKGQEGSGKGKWT